MSETKRDDSLFMTMMRMIDAGRVLENTSAPEVEIQSERVRPSVDANSSFATMARAHRGRPSHSAIESADVSAERGDHAN